VVVVSVWDAFVGGCVIYAMGSLLASALSWGVDYLSRPGRQ